MHKVVTINTPHLGSQLASQLLAPADNGCVRTELSLAGRPIYSSATVGGSTVTGGVGDLLPSSAAVAAIHQGAALIPMAMIAGKMTASQLAGGGNGATANLMNLTCRLSAGSNTLITKLFGGQWPALMQSSGDAITGGDSDGIVPLNSQFDGDASYLTNNAANVTNGLHSQSTELLGFLPPSVFDQASGGPAAILNVLNTPVSSTGVYVKKP